MCSTDLPNIISQVTTTQSENVVSLSDKIDKSIKKLELINQWASNCDTKSSFILAFLGVMVTIIFTSNIGYEMLSTLKFRSTCNINCTTIKNFTCLVTFISFCYFTFLTIWHLYHTLRGRIDPKVYECSGLQKNSNIFFQSIASKSFEEYKFNTNMENDDTYLNDINSQIYIISKIVTTKFQHYNSSLKSTLYSFGTFVLFIILRSI